MKLKILSLFPLLMMTAPAAMFAQSVLGVTPTQAVLHYQASGSTVCQVQVSQNHSMTPLAADVDPTLFPGANLDNRAGNVSTGSDRYFLVGKRRADLAPDGTHYSRALQAFTEYFYQITCGTSVQSGRFVTANPPLGNNYPEPPPFDATGFGNYAWPTIDWNDQSKSYIDPMTGILIKRATSPGWYGESQTGKSFGFALDLNNAWNNAGNVLSGNTSSVAGYSGAGGDPIFVALPPSQLVGFGGYGLGGWSPGQSLDNLLVRVFGTGSGTISGCLSDDSGAHCVSPAFDIATLANSGGNPAATFPVACGSDSAQNCFPNNGFWGGWNFTPIGWQMGVDSGSVNVTGSTVNAGQNTSFNLNWKTGTRIFIGGSAPACANNLCTISSMTSSSSLTIFESPGTLNAAQFQSAASGVVLWVKKTGGTSTASISVNFDYSYSDQFTMPYNGTVDQCSPNPTTVSYAADGVTPITPVQGELCLAAHVYGPNQVLYLLIPSTGETRFLAPIWFFNGADQASDQVGTLFQMLGAGFDATDPNTFYGQSNTAGGLSVFRGVYNGAQYHYKAYSHSLYPSVTASYQPGEDTSQYWFHGGAWADTGVTWTNITKASQGKDLGSQIAANNPNYDPSIFITPAVTHVGNGRAFTGSATVGYGETISLVNSFDLSTGSIVQTTDTWSKFPSRWCATHSNVDLSGWYGLICNPLGGAYGFGANSNVVGVGPWQMTPTAMLKGGAFVADTSMTAASPRDACPTIPAFLASFVPANPACVTFQSQMACSHAPQAAEKTKWPCEYNANWSELQKMAPGDGLLVVAGPGDVETLLLISVTGLGNANYQFTAVRGTTGTGFLPAPTGWAGYAVPPSSQCAGSGCTPGVGLWFDGLAPNVAWLLDPGAFSGHSDLGNGPTPGANSYCQTTVCRFNIPMAQQIGSFKTAKAFQPSAFGGNTGAIALQGYPSIHQFTAPPSEKAWMLNFRHINPSFGAGPEVQVAVGSVGYNLVAGTQSVFRFTSVNGGLNYKVAPVWAYAGYHTFLDVSSPVKGNLITDSTPWNYCVVLNVGECRAGSAVGEVYITVPHGVLRGDQNCISNWYDDNFPCVFTAPPQAAWGIQQDISRDDPNGVYWRRITMGFSGPGRQFEFASFIPDPTGTWAFMEGYYPDGVRNDLLMAKLPPWPNPQDVTTNRSTFEMQAVQISANANQPNARVRFGYAENGPVTSYNCTQRNETCVTGGSPYSFIGENPAWQSCSGGCTVQVPAIPGRVLFYAIDRQDGSGNVVTGNTQVAVVR